MAVHKPTLIIYANCQGIWLEDHLQRIPWMAEKYNILYIPSWDDPAVRDRVLGTEVFTECGLLLHQVASFIPEVPFEEMLSDTCRRIKIPILWMNLFWPLYAIDPRNQPQSDYPFGLYPYGDRLVIELLNKGLSPQEVYQSYMETDLKKMVDLDRWYEICMDSLHAIDENADIQLFSYIEQYFRERRLFVTINHSTDYLLERILSQVIEAELDASVADKNLPASTGAGMGPLEVPIHPTLIDYYGLKWASKDMLYSYAGQNLTFNQYLRQYIAFEPPHSNPPDREAKPTD